MKDIVTNSGESCAPVAYTLVEGTNMPVRCWVRVLLSSGVLLGLIALTAPNAYGQTEAATIRGAVTDSTGAVVSNAAVRLADVDRGTRSESQTNGSGFLNFASS